MKKITSEITSKWADTIIECYKTDEKLLSTYHAIAPCSLEEASKHTIDTLLDIANVNKYAMFRVEYDGELMGYYGLEVLPIQGIGKMQMVTGFFLKPKFRSDIFKKMFVSEIRSKFPQEKFMTVILSKNERALRFFMNQGAEVLLKNKALIKGLGEAEYVLLSV